MIDTLKNGSGLSSVSLDTVSAVTVLIVTADCVRYIQNGQLQSRKHAEYRIQNAGSRPDNTLQCTATWNNTWFVMTDQVLLQESAAAELQYVCYGQRLQSREHTEYKIQNTKYRSATSVLVPSSKSLQLCHRRSLEIRAIESNLEDGESIVLE